MNTRNKQVLLAFIFIIIVVAGGLFAWKKGWLNWGNKDRSQKVEELSLKSAYPAGWPEGLPLDKERLVEQKQLDYPDSTLYSVVYRSPEQLESIYANYKVYFEKNGYELATSTKTQQFMTVKGTKDKTQVSALITPDTGGNRVTLAILIRK